MVNELEALCLDRLIIELRKARKAYATKPVKPKTDECFELFISLDEQVDNAIDALILQRAYIGKLEGALRRIAHTKFSNKKDAYRIVDILEPIGKLLRKEKP